MKNGLRMVIPLGLAGLLSGCGAYSDLVNTLAPDEPEWEIALSSGGSLRGGGGEAHECVAPLHRELYMVMPEEGKEGTVVVQLNDGREVVLHGAYSAMALAAGAESVYTGTEEELQQAFGGAVSALPPAPKVSRLYFVFGTDQLTNESAAAAQEVYADVLSRQASEVKVVGHTDTVGSDMDNNRLSLRRAETVREGLVELGVPAETIEVSGAGESELLVETPDNTDEPMNRRVDINVR